MAAQLGKYLSKGDILIDLSWNIDGSTIVGWCHDHGVRYINTSVEEWDVYAGIETKNPHDRALYPRQMKLRKLKAKWRAEGSFPGPTILVDHGANPGWVNHMVKRGLLEIGQ
jgi:homospermidine synthase